MSLSEQFIDAAENDPAFQKRAVENGLARPWQSLEGRVHEDIKGLRQKRKRSRERGRTIEGRRMSAESRQLYQARWQFSFGGGEPGRSDAEKRVALRPDSVPDAAEKKYQMMRDRMRKAITGSLYNGNDPQAKHTVAALALQRWKEIREGTSTSKLPMQERRRRMKRSRMTMNPAEMHAAGRAIAHEKRMRARKNLHTRIKSMKRQLEVLLSLGRELEGKHVSCVRTTPSVLSY